MFASSGEATAPCGVPTSVFDHFPSSDTPAISHFWIRHSILRSAIRCSMNLTSHSCDKLSKDPTTHYPPQRPARACHHHSPTTSVGREKTRCLWTTALPRQVTSDPNFAQRRSRTHTQGVDRHRGSLAGSANARQTPHSSWFHSGLASRTRYGRRSPQSSQLRERQRRQICGQGERPSCNAC